MQAITAIYVRLSKEDLNTDYSKSIENQINGLIEYCNKNRMKVFDIYSDDGYSGSDFNRPAFKSMIKDMEKKKFNTIVVKDLSRLGRNFVRVGEYIENVFPNNNIRFISLSDNYDSLTYEDDESIVIRSFLNDYYLKECKKKAQAAVKKRSTTKAMSTGGIYGYKYDENKNLIIDEPAAIIVKEIYDRIISKEKPKTIIEDLIMRKIPTPGYQSLLNYGKNRFKVKEDFKYTWTHNMIRKIITNIEYTGTAVNREKVYKNGKWHINKNPILIENAVAKIISIEQFNLAQDNRLKTQYNIKDDLDDLRLKGVIYCKECNKPMTYERETNKYICRRCKLRIEANVIHKVALLDSQAIIKEFNNNRTEFQKNTIAKILDDYNIKRYSELSKRKTEIDSHIEKLFEDKLERKITALHYKSKIDILKDEITLIEKELSEFENLGITEKLLIDKFKEYAKGLEKADIENEMEFLKFMIKRIIASSNNSLKIIYRFSEV